MKFLIMVWLQKSVLAFLHLFRVITFSRCAQHQLAQANYIVNNDNNCLVNGQLT